MVCSVSRSILKRDRLISNVGYGFELSEIKIKSINIFTSKWILNSARNECNRRLKSPESKAS